MSAAGPTTDPSAAGSAAPTERERKLIPPAGFSLAALEGALPDLAVHALPTLELRATYFDTEALTLARAGITLRHRTGDGAPRWTLKLPAGGRGEPDHRMVRRELDLEGGPERRPPELAAILAAHLRGRRLVAVAELQSHRRRVRVGADGGPDLVEVAHDAVTARRGRRTLCAWEEVEVELLDERGAEVERRIARALADVGCAPAPMVPKLVRALGDDATAAPEVSVPELARHPSVTDTVRHALARSVAQIVAHDPAVRLGGDPEDLHQLRVGIRRLRSDLRTFRDLLDADAAEALRAELTWIADETSELRDLDVLDGWLAQQAASLPAGDRTAMDELVERYRDLAADRRAALLQALASPRYGRLLDELVALPAAVRELDAKGERRARRHLAHRLERRWRRLADAVAEVERDPTDLALHRARIAAKKCRATAEAVEPLLGRDVRRFARSLARLQDVLGAVHDAAMFGALLRRSSGTPSAFVAGQLTALARVDGQAHQARWPRVWRRVQRRHAAI